MKNLGVLFLLVFTTLISCKVGKVVEENDLVKLTISSNDSLKIKLTEIVNIATLDFKDHKMIISKDHEFVDSLEVKKPMLCFLLAENTPFMFYALPQKEQNITLKKGQSGTLEIVFDKGDIVNQFTALFHKDLMPFFQTQADTIELQRMLVSYQKDQQKALKKIQSKLDESSYKMLTSMITGKIQHLKFMHSERFPNLKPTSNYYNFVDDFKIEDDNYLTYSDNLNTVLGVLRIRYERKNNKPFNEANDRFDFVNTTIKNKEVKSAIICFLANETIPELSENEKELLLKRLNQFSIIPSYLAHIENTKTGTAVGKKVGNRAKYLETLIPYNKDFSLKQLEGKTVYIDNWATWCGPCMKSMKAFKEKQKILNKIDDIIFVFVSFDRNENIWRNYVKKSLAPNQKIIHLYNGMEMNSDYGKFYNISGLPSYLVIDKQGLIYDINPQTPKNSNFEEYLNNITK